MPGNHGDDYDDHDDDNDDDHEDRNEYDDHDDHDGHVDDFDGHDEEAEQKSQQASIDEVHSGCQVTLMMTMMTSLGDLKAYGIFSIVGAHYICDQVQWAAALFCDPVCQDRGGEGEEEGAGGGGGRGG